MVVADIDLGYALLSLTSKRQLVVVPLDHHLPSATSITDKLVPLDASVDAPVVAETEAMSSFLTDHAFTVTPQDFDAILAGKSQRQETIGQRGSRPLNEITTDDLRIMGTLMQMFSQAVLEVKKLSNRVEGRADLQVKEVGLQLQRLKTAMIKVDQLNSKRPIHGDGASDDAAANGNDDDDNDLLGDGAAITSVNEIKTRLSRISSTQTTLARRLEAAHAKLSTKWEPELGHDEREWAAEMARVERSLDTQGGEGGTDGVETWPARQRKASHPSFESIMIKTNAGLA